MTATTYRDYQYYRDLIGDRRLPLALVDLDRFDANVAYVAGTQQNSGKTIENYGRYGLRGPDCLGQRRRPRPTA
jgi:hypothetical protein